MNYKSLLPLLGFILLIFLQGCSNTTVEDNTTELEPAQNTFESLGISQDETYSVDIYDPWENLNRKTYNLNSQIDTYVLLPTVSVYESYVPRLLRKGVHNFYSNLHTVNHTVNSALQLKGEKTINNGLRFISNTTLGIAGIFDVATGMGLPEQQEDFGQVLGHWGVPAGPYLVLPFYGPSNLRDATGTVADFFIADLYIDGFGMNGNAGWEVVYYGLMGVDIRANMFFRYYDSLTPFEYDMIRMMYTAQRRVLIGK
ncbi:MAG: VacJ family lipoprotein [Gammaproteobacteria bacterium]|nr:VacJ family lipoprotein [Gammaproteobacteria bacterium]